MHLIPRLRTLAKRLRSDDSGLALLEFAFAFPIILMMGMYGIETANLALVNLRVSQIALNLADNAARVGVNNTLSIQQLREVDINDVLQAARLQGQSIDLTTNGRIILSSLENIQQSYDTAGPVQRIHWQRCLGKKSGTGYDSSYNTATPLTTAGTDNTSANAGRTVTGMGDPVVTAPSGSGLMFVEINYNYKPLISGYLLGTGERIHYVASFIVRDNRDFSQLTNPGSVAKSTCNLYTKGVGGATS